MIADFRIWGFCIARREKVSIPFAGELFHSAFGRRKSAKGERPKLAD
jgi:hypothetical protein